MTSAPRRRIRSAAAPIAIGALAVVALAGTAGAAGLITGKDIQNNSVTSKDIKNDSLKLKDFAATQRAKLVGPQGPQGVPGAPGLTYAWSGSTYRNTQYINGAGGPVAHLTFTAPSAGFVVATTDFAVRVRNNGTTDCRVRSQLAPAAGLPEPIEPTAATAAGYADQWVNANLPTQAGAGTFLQLSSSATRVLPVVAGTNNVYLNGQSSCAGSIWGPVTITATFVANNPAATVTPN